MCSQCVKYELATGALGNGDVEGCGERKDRSELFMVFRHALYSDYV